MKIIVLICLILTLTFSTVVKAASKEVITPPVYTTVGDYTEALPANLSVAISTTFGIEMHGFQGQQLVWAWEVFKQLSKTKFNDYVRGAVIQMVVNQNGYSQQVGCANRILGGDHAVELHPHDSEIKFKLTILHELGHVIYHCNGEQSKQWQKDFEAVIAAEGGITTYGENPGCVIGFTDTGDAFAGRRRSEDFAEMIAYYLLPTENERDITHCPVRGGPPFANNQFPLHHQFAISILGEI